MSYYYLLSNAGNYYVKNIENGGVYEIDNEEGLYSEMDVVRFVNNMYGEKCVTADDELDLYVVCTMKCNLSCIYCFEKNKPSISMNNQTINQVIRVIEQLTNNKSYKKMEITFTGGEPILAFDAIREMTELLSYKVPSNVQISYSIISNGSLLNKEILQFLDDHCFSLQLSFDGNRDRHDAYRKWIDTDKGTYDDLIDLLGTIRSDFPNIFVSIRINLTKRNIVGIESLILDIAETYPDVYIYPDFVTVSIDDDLFVEPHEKEVILSDVIKMLYNHGMKTIHRWSEGRMCMIKNSNAFTVYPDGTIYKCYSVVGKEEYAVGEIDSFSEKMMDGAGDLCENKKCVYHNLCFGGCPFDSLVTEGNMKKKCSYELLDYINKSIFLLEIGIEGDVSNIRVLNYEDEND